MNKDNWEWFSLYWFYPNTLLDFEWGNLTYLYFILAIPLVFISRRLLNWKLRQKVELALFNENIRWSPSILFRYIPNVFLVSTLLLLIIALARPQKSNIQIEQNSEGIDILLLIDVSESMLLEDFKPNRLEASKKVAIEFIRGRLFDRIGLIVFSGEAYSLSPLTTDYDMLESYIQEINYQMIPQAGTAIGNALGMATNRFRESSAKSKVAILISDGDNTAGSLDPLTAAQLATYYGLKIYTIIVGTEGDVPLPSANNDSIKYVKNTIDESTLREIAKIGEGEFFRATNSQTLSKIFEKIDEYEKSEIIETRFTSTKDYYNIYLIWSIIAWLLWLFCKSSFISNVLED